MVAGILIVIIFVVLAILMMTKKIPTLLALPIMAIAIGIVAGLPLTGKDSLFDTVIQAGSQRLVGTFVPILFSCWLAQILYRTGVTNTIIKKAAELGGDKPYIVAILINAVTILLFTTLFGTGAVAMVGAVVLPILMSLGIPPIVACNSFLAAMTAGYMLNPANLSAIVNVTRVSATSLNLAAVVSCIIGALFTLIYLTWSFKKNGLKFALSAPVDKKEINELDPPPSEGVTGIRGFLACLSPIIVVVIFYIFKWNATVVFLIGIVWAMVFTFKGKWSKYMNLVIQSSYEGFKEGAPTVGLMFGIGMLLSAVLSPQAQEAIAPFMNVITPKTATSLMIFVCVFCPLGLYRGPFNLLGLGGALAASMLVVIGQGGAYSAVFLGAVFYAVFRWPTQSCPTSTQVVWASNFVGYDPVTTSNKVQLANWVTAILATIVIGLLYIGK